MQVKEIVARVRSAIDEVMENDSDFLAESSDEQNLTSIIIDKIPYALTYIVENAPDDKLDGGALDSLTTDELDGLAIAAGQPVKVKLPENVIRVVSARLSSWSQSPVPVSESSQEYLMQQDEYARGSWDRPVSAIAYHGKDRYIELYSARADSDNVVISIVRKPTATDISDPETEIGIPVRLEAAYIYQISGLVMVAFREQVSETLFRIAQQYLASTVSSRENERK